MIKGYGNNGEDGGEGCVYRNAVGTYLHGSLLPKNPRLADWFILQALRRRHDLDDLPELDDSLESAAHRAVLEFILREKSWRAGRASPRVKSFWGQTLFIWPHESMQPDSPDSEGSVLATYEL